MLSKIAPPIIRAATGLELAAGLFAKSSGELASQLTITLAPGKKGPKQLPLRIGINGDVYGGMRTPIEKSLLQIPLHPGALKYYSAKGYFSP